MSITSAVRCDDPWRALRPALLAAISPVLALNSTSALALWSLVPQLGAGITWESNPAYSSDELKQERSGTFANLGLNGNYATDTDQLTLATSFQQTNYLDNEGRDNENLNSENWSATLGANHSAERGGIGLSAGYVESPIRSGDTDPNAPPDASNDGRFSDGTQKNVNLGMVLNYNLSPRNRVALNVNTGEYNI